MLINLRNICFKNLLSRKVSFKKFCEFNVPVQLKNEYKEFLMAALQADETFTWSSSTMSYTAILLACFRFHPMYVQKVITRLVEKIDYDDYQILFIILDAGLYEYASLFDIKTKIWCFSRIRENSSELLKNYYKNMCKDERNEMLSTMKYDNVCQWFDFINFTGVPDWCFKDQIAI